MKDQLLSILLAFRTTTHNVLFSGLLRTASATFEFALRVGRVTSTGGTAFTTTVWVIHRVHSGTASLWTNAFPAHAAGFAPGDVDLFGVADFSYGCAAAVVHVADLTGWEAQLCVFAFTGNQLDRCSSRTCQFSTTAWAQFHSVDHGTQWDVAKGQVVAWFDVGIWARLHHVALLQTSWGEDVALGSIDVVQQSNVGGTVRVVFDMRDLGRDAIFIMTTEVDQTVLALMSATTVT